MSRPSLSISLPESLHSPSDVVHAHMPKTPEAQRDDGPRDLIRDPPPPPRPQAFKVKRKRVSSAQLPDTESLASDDNTLIIPTIEMSEVAAHSSSPTLQPTSAHLLSPLPLTPRALTPPRTPTAKSLHQPFGRLDSPAPEWDLINHCKPAFAARANSVCSSFSDSSVSSRGSSDFSLPTTGASDSPTSCELPDPFLAEMDAAARLCSFASPLHGGPASPRTKRVKTRRDLKWTPQMDDHLWMTFMSYLADPTMTPFKMLPGSTPPMGVCDQVATKAKATWRPKAAASYPPPLAEHEMRGTRDGSPDTIRPTTSSSSSLYVAQPRWPKVAATRRRLREICARRPSISAHYQRMLRTRSPSPFETSSSFSSADFSRPRSHTSPSPKGRGKAAAADASSSRDTAAFSGLDMVMSLVTSTASSMQADGLLAQLARDETPHAPVPAAGSSRAPRPEGWFDRIPRSKAHQKSASLQSELRLRAAEDDRAPVSSDLLASPFDVDPGARRSRLLQSMTNTKSLGRTEFNGRSLDAPVDFAVGGAPTDRRSRKRRFRSDEEKPRRPPLGDVFGPPVPPDTVRGRGFTVGAVRATDDLTRLFAPAPQPQTPSISVDHVMGEAHALDTADDDDDDDDIPLGSRSAPRRLAEPVPRLGSPFAMTAGASRQHNTFPRSSLLPSLANGDPFRRRVHELADAPAPDQPSGSEE